MRCTIAYAFLLTLTAACGGETLAPTYDLSGNAMGTTFNITLVAPPATAALDQLQTDIVVTIEHIEAIASTYRGESEISLFNASKSTDWFRVSPEFCSLVAGALEVSHATNGAFDITVAPLVNLWGFGPDMGDDQLPGDAAIAAAIETVGYQHLATDCDQPAIRKEKSDTAIDLSGWAKGYAVDQVAAFLNARDIDRYLVEIGGELSARGKNAEGKDFSIAIEKPMQTGEMEYTVIRLSNAAVATSGDYRNFFEKDGRRYSHTIDPLTGRPIEHQLTGVTVVSDSAAFADAMATALLVLGPDKGKNLADDLNLASYFLLRTNGELEEFSTRAFEELRNR